MRARPASGGPCSSREIPSQPGESLTCVFRLTEARCMQEAAVWKSSHLASRRQQMKVQAMLVKARK